MFAGHRHALGHAPWRLTPSSATSVMQVPCPPVHAGGHLLFLLGKKRRDVVDQKNGRQVNDRTDGQEDERNPNG